jgi:hypothetical protein
MRVSRLVIVGLSGLVAMHIFMLAGHGHGHDPFAGMQGLTAHAATATSPVAAPDQDDGDTGMQLEMTVACLAVAAGCSCCSRSNAARRPPALWASASVPGTRPAPTPADLECDHLRSSASR